MLTMRGQRRMEANRSKTMIDAQSCIELRSADPPIMAAKAAQRPNLAFDHRPGRKTQVTVNVTVGRPPRIAEIIGRDRQARAHELAAETRIDLSIGTAGIQT